MNVSITGGIPPYNFYAYGPDNFISSDISSLQNIKGGTYNLYAYTAAPNYCYGYTAANVPDVAGFEPELVVQDIDCTTGYGSAAVINVTTPGAQYEWNMGATGPALFNLTQGCYSVTVTAGGACVTYFDNICLQSSDTIQFNSLCAGIATGALINDLGIVGCTGSTGIPFQLIRTMPSGALHFTDQNGVYTAQLPNGAFDIEALNYDPSDIACPPGGFHTVNSVINTTTSGLDFHFYNTNATDHRVRQKALRTAQPGYPYSLRYEVCNDGATANAGVMDLAFGNFFGSLATAAFPRHPGAFTLNSETAGIPDNTANFGFPAITPGGCEMLQVDFLTPTSTPVGTEFITRATVSPSSGDPTPDNNIATLFNTVTGSFDPNSVLAFPARNGNPRDGGSIWWNIDHTITYQIFFQNTGNAPADFVMVRDTLDVALNVSTIRNMSASHDVDISLENDNKVLVFKFPNIGLPDSTSDFAGSIGSVQFDIDLHPGLPPGTEISKQAAIYFDFNSPVITNNNLLKIVSNTGTNAATKNALILFPNPAVQYFGFFTDTAAGMRMFNAMGELVSVQQLAPGIQQISTEALPSGVYFVHVEADGKVQSGKVVVSH
ncbi:MAG: T9SS type A sorting domain-containing protein [Lewinellaceae bacterium]|nr:T9SS type A sorting domain-containing protein [Lewinellaceae bacterium]